MTKEEIYEQLKAQGAPRGPVVMVHSSLKHVGPVEGGGDALLEALIRYFTEEGGLLCIPTFTYMNIGKTDAFTCDMASDEVCIGTLPKLALHRPDGHRSEHPSHSMVVFGPADKCEEFIKNEPFVNTPCSPDGCYGNLYRMGGYVMLLGVGLERLTYLHSVEEMLDVPDRVSDETQVLTVRRKDGTVVERVMHCHKSIENSICTRNTYPSDYFMKMETAFRTYEALTDLRVGAARATLCNCRIVRDVQELVFKNANGEELFCDDVPVPAAWYRKN